MFDGLTGVTMEDYAVLEELVALQKSQLEVYQQILDSQNNIIKAARDLFEAMTLATTEGPIFEFSEDSDECDQNVVTHAMASLWAVLDGAELPHFIPPEVTH